VHQEVIVQGIVHRIPHQMDTLVMPSCARFVTAVSVGQQAESRGDQS